MEQAAIMLNVQVSMREAIRAFVKGRKTTMSKRAEQKALEAYPRSEKYTSSQRLIINDLRDGFIQGYEQAEKDILSKFTKEHLEGLKWIKNAGISTQPVPYHKYCKDLYKVLKELLKEKYDIQGNTST